MEEKTKIFDVKIIDVLDDDIEVSYLNCDLDKVVSFLSNYNGYPRKLIITSVIS